MDMDMAITRDELNKGILNLKKHKSSGTDEISNAMTIYGGEHLHAAILTILNNILDTWIYLIQLIVFTCRTLTRVEIPEI